MKNDFVGDKIRIDNFAYKRYHTHETIIVDEIIHNIITLLDGRDYLYYFDIRILFFMHTLLY